MVSLWDTTISLHILQLPLEGAQCSGSQIPKDQDLPKFQFWGGGGLLELKSESAKNQIPEQSVVRNLSTNFAFASQIVTDSLSHTTYVETNKKSLNIKAAVCETQSFPMLHFQFAEVSYLKVTTIKDVFREDVPGTQMC